MSPPHSIKRENEYRESCFYLKNVSRCLVSCVIYKIYNAYKFNELSFLNFAGLAQFIQGRFQFYKVFCYFVLSLQTIQNTLAPVFASNKVSFSFIYRYSVIQKYGNLSVA